MCYSWFSGFYATLRGWGFEKHNTFHAKTLNQCLSLQEGFQRDCPKASKHRVFDLPS
jgi:hypothetical protein